jgi:hypothetical protein
MIALALIWLLTYIAPASGDPLELQYIQGDVYSDASEGSSLPSRFNQRVVKDVLATTALMRPTKVPALFAVVLAPYETVRDRLIPSVRQMLGENSFFEEKHNDHVEWTERYGQAVDSDQFHEKRRQEKERELTNAGIRWQSYREARIVTKTYNEIWWKGGRSQALFRIIDGRDLFDRACTIVLITRTDFELQFGFLHNLPIPVIGLGDDPLVTDREIGLVEQVQNDLGVPVTYFVASVSSLSDNATPLLEIKDRCGKTSAPAKH